MDMNPDSLMQALFSAGADDDMDAGEDTLGAAPVAPAAPRGALARPQAAAATIAPAAGGNRLGAARKQVEDQVLARLSQPARSGTMMDSMAAGLTAQTPKVSQNKVVALLNGLFSGGAAAYNARKPKDDLKDRIDLLSKLGILDKQDRQLALQDRRTAAYERWSEKTGNGGTRGGSRGRSPLQIEKDINSILKEHPAAERLKSDETASSRNKLPPDERQRLVDELKAERDRLRELEAGRGLPERGGRVTTPGSQSPAPSAPRPATPPAPAKPSKAQILGDPSFRRIIDTDGAPAAIAEAKRRFGVDITIPELGLQEP